MMPPKEKDPPEIVIIGPAHPLRGGLASYNERLAREFISKGFRTLLYTFSYQYPSFLFPGKTQYSNEPAPKDIPIRVDINSINPFNWIRVGNELKRLSPKIIVVRFWLPFMGPALGTILRRVRKNKHTKIVCIADNIIPHEKRPGDKSFTRYFINPVDAFITMSEKVLKDVSKVASGKPSRFVPHPLYDNFGAPVSKKEAREILQLPQETKILLFFGFIRKYKGLDLLLQAFKLLKKKQALPDLKLLIAGEFYEDKKNYTALLNDPDIKQDLILHTDFIDDHQVRYYFCAADGVIQPYRHATQSGVTPLAYHFEIPMVVTDVGGLPAMVPPHTGIIALPEAGDIANKIKLFFSESPSRFIPGLQQEKQQYSWERMVEAILQMGEFRKAVDKTEL